MPTLILAARDKFLDTTLVLRSGGVERCAFVLTLFALAMTQPGLRHVVLAALSDAYLSVGVFVAATFALFFWLEARFEVDTGVWIERHRGWEIPVAAGLGALPGCGGAVMVITQFAMGRASFGAVVAVLTSTMGDAAFLMLARRPTEGLALIAIGFVTGTVSGRIVNMIHGPEFLRVSRPATFDAEAEPLPIPPVLWSIWGCIAVPGLILGVLALFQLDLDPTLMMTVGAAGGLLSITTWALSSSQAKHMATHRTDQTLAQRVALNTNFVMVWVVIGFLAFEIAGGGPGLAPVFATAPAFLPLLGILVGFLPGCGPQILVTTLYLSGLLPFSAQLGNAISNDGDALFPAIAIVPRAAIVATLYTAVPAVLLGYGFLLLVEMGAPGYPL